MSFRLFLALLAFQNPDLLEQGRKALDANRNEEAAALFRKAVAADARDYAAHFHLALADGLLKRDEESIAEYRKTLELKPNLYQAELNLGMVLLRNRRYSEAAEPLKSAEAQKPEEFRTNYYLGDALLHTGNAPDAQRYLEAALKATPNAAGAQLSLARALLAQGNLSAADVYFRKAAAQDPAYRDALLELAAADEKAAKADDAIEIYKQFPNEPGAQERLGELLIESKQFSEAIPRLEKAVADSPAPANRLALATAYRMNKQLDKQNEQLSKAVAAEPANFDLHMIYGRALRDQKQPMPAANQFQDAARIKPDAAEAWNELGQQLILAQHYEQGLAALDQVKALGHELPGDVYLRAITLDKLHRKPEAVNSYKQFLAASEGKFPDQEFAARQRIRILDQEMHGR